AAEACLRGSTGAASQSRIVTSTAAAATASESNRDAARRLRAFGCRARSAHRAVVLTIAVDPIRNLLVDGDVIHLADRQRDGLERLAVIGRETRAQVVGQTEMVGILRIDPDVVIVAAPRNFGER